MRRPPILALAVTLPLVLAGCSGGDADDAPGDAPPSQGAGAAPGSDDAAPGSSPAPGQCAPVPADGDVYEVADAGTVTVRRDGDRLVLEGVQPASGWTHEVTAEEPTEIEVELLRDGQELDFDVEIEDDGSVEAEVCAEG